MAQMRLQRFLAQAGIASRRKAEQLITDGKVRVNGRVANELGTKVDPDRDKVVVAGQRAIAAQTHHVLLCKPKGYVSTLSDPEGRPTVVQLLGDRARGLYPVGRLDYHTDGALLLTNDGDLAHALMHPSRGVAKTYHAKLHGTPTPETLQQLRDGVVLPDSRRPDSRRPDSRRPDSRRPDSRRPDSRRDAAPSGRKEGRDAAPSGRKEGSDDGRRTRPAEVRILASTGKHTWIEITIREGRNRQIHRMAEAVGHDLLKLSRVAYGGISVEGLKPGDWRALRPEEVQSLREQAGAKSTFIRKRAAPKRRR